MTHDVRIIRDLEAAQLAFEWHAPHYDRLVALLRDARKEILRLAPKGDPESRPGAIR